LFLLAAWYTLNAKAAEQTDPPALSATWAELHPGSVLDTPGFSELARVDEWLALAQLLLERDPAALNRLGFHDRDRDLVESLIVILPRITRDSEGLRPLAESVLSRLEELVPDLATDARDALRSGRLFEAVRRERWWVPEDIPARPTTEPVTFGPTDFGRQDVERVLSDL
jgi:hypothetical protein